MPAENDDLELKIDDYLYVSTEALNSSTPDGWLEGTSWCTGCSGYFLENYTCRVPESDAWTLHKSITLNKCENLEDDMGDAKRHLVLTKEEEEKFKLYTNIASLKDVTLTTKCSSVSNITSFKSSFST